ncbi:unnamed protein product [Pseudo-nitzschia multistriata]|uniref:Uncharacterized protein n=1 Tax=Pseudo-nitzschia multistriata TaxID=183589 RepID=A0A448Z3U8_9STRA|nr:unnamed protein product [Pseudo-nitzschia multistriata]
MQDKATYHRTKEAVEDSPAVEQTEPAAAPKNPLGRPVDRRAPGDRGYRAHKGGRHHPFGGGLAHRGQVRGPRRVGHKAGLLEAQVVQEGPNVGDPVFVGPTGMGVRGPVARPVDGDEQDALLLEEVRKRRGDVAPAKAGPGKEDHGHPVGFAVLAVGEPAAGLQGDHPAGKRLPSGRCRRHPGRCLVWRAANK